MGRGLVRVKWIAAAVAVSALFSGAAFSQALPAAHITVSQAAGGDDVDAGMFTSIQKAVNAAKPGNVIEIQDLATYKEQVTIDSTKHGITIRSKNPTSASKPVIQWQDTENQSPKTGAEAKKPGDGPGTSGNFETCGALRIKRAQGVTIDGIIVDGGGPAPFAWPGIWNDKDPLAHGNAAITLVVAGGAVIRNCELRNAYIGLNVKDRNTGGVFGNPNPADNDQTIPLSGFGKVGNHLIEYNRIHDNSLGIFFESAWDLASTVRYNLIYNNFHIQSVLNFINAPAFPAAEKNNMASGAIMFKDMVYTPVAIYNNTFHNNYLNLIGHWKVAAPHLLFNNIFGKSSVPFGSNGKASFNNFDYMAMDSRFPNRMHNSIFSAYLEISTRGGPEYLGASCNHLNYDTLRVDRLVIWNNFLGTAGTEPFTMPACPATPVNMTDVVAPGALIAGQNGNVRWLETTGRALTNTQSQKTLLLDTLFQSVDPGNSKFLWPKWDHPLVQKFIQNKGWEAAGIRNADGNIADLGAISSNNGVHQPTLARIKPSNVVLISGGEATASFSLTLESGTMTNPKIKLIRWVAPLPDFTNFGGSDAPVVASNSIRAVTPQGGVAFGSNTLKFAITGTVPEYGFFELVVEGTDANGKTVTSDVGFLTYRELKNYLSIEVYPPSGNMVPANSLKEVIAGQQYRVQVIAKDGPGASDLFTKGNLQEVEYRLLSHPTAMMWREIDPEPGNPLTREENVTISKTYMVYFTRAGDENIFGSGRYDDLVFLGNRAITVLPGDPAKIEFKYPIPKSQIPPGALPAVINRGVPTEVLVQVQDRFGNAVKTPVEVQIRSSDAGIGDVGASSNINTKAVRTDSSGMAVFMAMVTGGNRDQTFDMTATMTYGGKTFTDVGTFRIGRTLAALQVFYSDAGADANATPDNSVKIDAMTIDWELITVRAAEGGAVLSAKAGCVKVESDPPGLVFSDAKGGAEATTFTMKDGVAKFYVNSRENYFGGVVVSMLGADCSTPDHSINGGDRGDIRFTEPENSILNAVVFCDGHGRPDSVIVRYASDGNSLFGGIDVPDSLRLTWGRGTDTVSRVTKEISRIDSFTVSGSFRNHPSRDAFPKGYTDISGNGVGLVMLYTKDKEDNFFDVLDGVGPIISDAGDMRADKASPLIVENLNPDTQLDTLIIMLSESLRDEETLQGTGALVYTTDEAPENNPATGGTALNVETAFYATGGYRVILAAASQRPAGGDWIRFAGGNKTVKDMAAGASTDPKWPDNGVHPNNRWVQLKVRQVPPEVVGAYYTANVRTGYLDYAYITFNKDVSLDTWFAGGYFRFGSGADSTFFGSAPERYLSLVDARTVRVDLSLAYPGSQKAVMTKGGMSVNIGFNVSQGWAPMVSVPIADRAKPVLADTVYLRIGSIRDDGTAEPDTLVVTYSEPLSDASRAVPAPVTIQMTTGLTVSPALRGDPKVSDVSGSDWQRLSYVIEPGSLKENNFPVTGDLVYIAHDAGVSDREGNDQDSVFNRRVPLKVERGPLKWKVVVKNNPFKSGAGAPASIEMTPSAKGAKVDISTVIRLYDNMGNLVIETTLPKVEKVVTWPWSGHNQKGRVVGTGTYLLKAVCDATVYGADLVSVEKKERYEVRRSIGFVR